ncbi:MAG: sugar phosphate isomerase/epimerase [Phycisphaerae bacterium]|nr:sugar phosphate isomerase/epimerase [Phycisphaerae bacterium]
MTIRLGTVAPVGFAEFADPAWLGCMRELGCSSVQVYRNRIGRGGDPAKPVTTREMRDYVAAGEMPCDSLHGLYGNDLDPSNPDESARRAAVDVFKAEGDLAMELGGPLVVVHCAGIVPEGRSVSAEERALRWSQLRKSAAELASFGQAQGVRYALENLPPYHFVGSDTPALRALLDELNSPRVGMCFDVAHANLVGDPIRATAAAAGQMIYVHICDNHGRSDDHLMPFCGTIDWNAFARALNEGRYTGVLMLEVFPALRELRRFLDEGMKDKLAAFLRQANGKPSPSPDADAVSKNAV